MFDYSRLSAIPKHIAKIKALVFFFSLIPFLILISEYYYGNLGIDPLDRLTRLTGSSALILLLLSLVITPLRHFLIIFMVAIRANYGKRLADWNWIIKTRRILGVMSFFYASLHLSIYFWLDQGADFTYAFYDIKERNFIAVGLIAFILLVPLALTSTNKMMRLLGKKWRRLHRAVYLIAVLVIVHFWMLSKVGVYEYIPYALMTLFLLGWRIWYYWTVRKDKLIDDGMEAVDREQINRIIKNLSFLAEKTFGEKEGEVIASILFNILSSEKHYSESLLNLNKDLNFEIHSGPKSMIKRLKLARKNAKEKISLQSILGMQAGHMPELLELVDEVDALLKDGIEAHSEENTSKLNAAWTTIFSALMPID